MKDYLIPIAIIVGAIIISATTYYAVTDYHRQKFELCIKYLKTSSTDEKKILECKARVYAK